VTRIEVELRDTFVPFAGKC